MNVLACSQVDSPLAAGCSPKDIVLRFLLSAIRHEISTRVQCRPNPGGA